MKENFRFEKSKRRERLRFEFSERILQLYGNKIRENRVKIISLSVKGKKHVEYVKFFSKEWKRISVSKKANGANGSSDLNGRANSAWIRVGSREISSADKPSAKCCALRLTTRSASYIAFAQQGARRSLPLSLFLFLQFAGGQPRAFLPRIYTAFLSSLSSFRSKLNQWAEVTLSEFLAAFDAWFLLFTFSSPPLFVAFRGREYSGGWVEERSCLYRCMYLRCL